MDTASTTSAASPTFLVPARTTAQSQRVRRDGPRARARDRARFLSRDLSGVASEMLTRSAIALVSATVVPLLAGTASAPADAGNLADRSADLPFRRRQGTRGRRRPRHRVQRMDGAQSRAGSAYVLTPQAFGPEIDFDVAWVGRWPDGATMGDSMAHRVARGGDRSAFDSVMRCDSQRNFDRHAARAG